MRTYLSRLLGERWQVETAPDGAVALQQIHADAPDLVIADAQKMDQGIIATVKLPFRLRSGTHTNWYPQSALPPIKDELT